MITFIIPSLARPTLKRTLLSIKNQYDSNWKAIVNFDDVNNPNYYLFDERITYVFNKRVRKYGGIIRNEAVKIAETEWVGFVDDDDTIEPNYIDCLKQEINKNPNLDCVVFRMRNPNGTFTPHPSVKTAYDIKRNFVGISFCCKKKIFDDGLKFNPCGVEDFDLINDIRSNGYNIILSSHCVYNVRKPPQLPQKKKKEFKKYL